MTAPRTLVSGGAGFVGRFIVEALLKAGHEVRVMGRTPPPVGFFSRDIEFVEGSLGSDADHSRAFDGVGNFVHAAFDHLPGKYRGGEGVDAAGFRRKNLDGTAALFEAAKRASVGHVVFLSSRAVYGRLAKGAELTEDMQPRPDTLYGEVKLAAEEALAALGRPGFRGVSLRATGVYGPAEAGREHKWVALFRDYLQGKPIEPRAGTEVHGDDLAAAVRIALEADEPPAILNVSDMLVDRGDLLAIVRDATGCRHNLPAAATDLPGVMAAERLRGLGWRPGGRVLLERTVRGLLTAA